MYALERQQAMAELVAQRGRLSVIELADRYGVTPETVRRDLDVLERASLVKRVHGGAVRADAVTAFELAVGDRAREHAGEKDLIAKAAVQFLPNANGAIILDAGTSTGALAAMLPSDRALTVLTNSVPIAARVAGSPGVSLHILPGRVRPTTQAAVGEEIIDALSVLRADVAFMGANGISLGHGLSTPDASEAAAKKAMIAAAHRVVVLADSSKFGVETTVRFAALTDVDVVITDPGIPEEQETALRELGVEVVKA
jgi:DeoR family transcriptional regulator, fructose operon transcriptional repressor